MSADFWAGYISGAAGILIGNPLDLLKTRLQAGDTSVHATSTESLRTTFDRAGTLVRGATAPILGYGALNGILYFTYNRTLTFLSENSSSPTSLTNIWSAGAAGGLATFLISAPTELIKCRTQVSRSSLISTIVGTQSSLSIAREIWARDGLRGMYFGGAVTSIRDAVGYGFYFWSYEICKRVLETKDEDTTRLAAVKVLLAGGIAGVVTWASIFPLDVIKTRVQTQPFVSFQSRLISPSASPPLSPTPSATSRLLQSTESVADPVKGTPFARRGAIEMAGQIYRTEGISPFFRGLGICSVRAFIVNAVQWAVYEWVMRVLKESSSDSITLKTNGVSI